MNVLENIETITTDGGGYDPVVVGEALEVLHEHVPTAAAAAAAALAAEATAQQLFLIAYAQTHSYRYPIYACTVRSTRSRCSNILKPSFNQAGFFLGEKTFGDQCLIALG